VACSFIGIIIIGGLVESLCWTERKAVDFSKNEGMLIPAGLPNPPFPCSPPAGALEVILGSVLSWTTRSPHTVVKMSDQQMLTIAWDEMADTYNIENI
jgi:hypothetical protein